jgi:hypothetical protein
VSVPIEPIGSAPVRHRGREDPQLLLGVAEGLLAARTTRGSVHDVLALGQVVEVQQPACSHSA